MVESPKWLAPYNDIYQKDWSSYEELRDEFEWEFPDSFNAAEYLCDRWGQERGRVAFFYEDRTADKEGKLTYWELQRVTDRLANYLEDRGVGPGDRIAVNTPQKIETVISHLAIWKTGATSVPLSILYGPDGLEYRLSDSETSLCIVDESNIDTHRDVARSIDSIAETLVVGDVDPGESETPFWEALREYPADHDIIERDIMDTMLILYSSGTTGPPKGIVQPHRCVVGHLPGIVANLYNCEINADDVLWTPSEWAWGASISNMIAALFFGRPMVAYESGESFDPREAFEVIEKYGVTLIWAVPSAIRMMMQDDTSASRFDFSSVRVVAGGGESFVSSAREWASETFDAAVHEVYGLTETFNWILGDCSAYDTPQPGWMGRALPGHDIEILDTETHEPLGAEEEGEIALREPNPTLFEEYLNKPEKTASAFSDGWFLTGDLGERNESGRFRFLGRDDDLIISSGYRIGPEEIEDTLISHDAVVDAGVIGVPDRERGEIPKAFVVLKDTRHPSATLKSEIQSFVKENLAAYEYPRQVEFIDEMPRTTTGKVRRTSLREREEGGEA